MPHQCTTCGNVFPDGSKEMLSGCPGCGGNTFQFHPGEVPEDAAPPDGPPGGAADRSHVASAVGKAADTLRGIVADRARPSSTPEPPTTAGSSDRPGGETEAPHGATGDDADPAETTQATLDALATDETADRDAEAVQEDSETVADRWPSVGTEAGVETDEREPSAETTDWPDPWSPDESAADDATAGAADETIVAGEDDVSVAARDDTDMTGREDTDVTGRDDVSATESVEDGSPTVAPDGPGDSTAGRDAETVAPESGDEDAAQAAARTSMVGPDELPDGTTSGRVVGEPTGERPDLAQLREELNDQFESIRVVAPGQYELNLMELYDREEYIIAIQENGRYVIEVPDAWEEPGEA